METESKNKILLMLVFSFFLSYSFSQIIIKNKEKKVKGRIEIHLTPIDSLYEIRNVYFFRKKNKTKLAPFRFASNTKDNLDHFLLDSTTSIFNNSLLNYNYTSINQKSRFCNNLETKEAYFNQENNTYVIAFNFKGKLKQNGKEYSYLNTKKVSRLKSRQIKKLKLKKDDKTKFIIFNKPVEYSTEAPPE